MTQPGARHRSPPAHCRLSKLLRTLCEIMVTVAMGHKPICYLITCFVTSPRPRAAKPTNLCTNTAQHLARVLYSYAMCGGPLYDMTRSRTFVVLQIVDFCSFIVFYPHLSMSIILKRDLFFLSAVVIFLITSMNFPSGSLEHVENINSNEQLCPNESLSYLPHSQFTKRYYFI